MCSGEKHLFHNVILPPLSILSQWKVRSLQILWRKDQNAKQCGFIFTAIFDHLLGVPIILTTTVLLFNANKTQRHFFFMSGW